MITTRESFFEQTQRKVVDYTDPESGATIRLKELHAGTAFKLLEMLSSKKPREEVCAWALIYAAVDEEDKPLFSEDDIQKVLDAKASDLLSMGSKALELSGIYGTKKNGSAGTAGSSTSSP